MGDDGSKYRLFYKHRAALSDTQVNQLNDIAKSCDRQVAQLDQQAKQVIDAHRALYPNGKLPPGQAPPAPPTELSLLQERRNAIILEAYDHLREAFGDSEFQRFHQFVKAAIVSDGSAVPAELQRPQGQRQPVLLMPGQRQAPK